MHKRASAHTFQTQIARGAAPQAILDAARELFAAKGYVATSILDIAAAAGVARPTVFTAVGTKPAIFRAVLEAAVAPENPSLPVDEQPWLIQVLDEPDPHRMLRLHARNIRRIGERISDLYWTAECAARTNESVRQVFETVEAGRLLGGNRVAAALARRTALRDGYDETSAGTVLNALISPASWRALVRDAGWTPDRFESWAADSASRLLLP